MESWKLQLNLLRIGSKRFQIILMLVIFISNWTRSTICVFLQHPLKKRTTTFLVSLQRARTWKKTTKCKEYKYYSEIEMLLIHKRIVSLLKGERGIGGGNAFISTIHEKAIFSSKDWLVWFTPIQTFSITKNPFYLIYNYQDSSSCNQGGRTWQPFVGGKKGHENFRQVRIYNFRDKCVVFARNRKFANLTQ